MAARDKIAEFARTLEPRVRDAFLESISNLRTGANLQALVDAIERGDVQGAFDALRIEAAAYDPLDRVLIDVYRLGGAETAAQMPARLRIRFDGRDPQAEAWARNYSSDLVTAIAEDQREAVRTTIAGGIEAGQGGRRIAVDIVGRVNPLTGQREGGILGLTRQQAEYVVNYRAELQSSDPKRLRNALRRRRRDKHFDATVGRAIDGEPMDSATVSKLVDRYKVSLLKLRGGTIARTEALTAVYAARHETFRQAVAKGRLVEDQITRTWRSASDLRVRDTHTVLNGQKVRGLTQPFVSPSGALLLYPHDPSAPEKERVSCRCDVFYRIDFTRGVR